MENFGRYIAVVLVVGLLFLLPVSLYSRKLARLQTIYTEQAGEEFFETVLVEKRVILTELEKLSEIVNRYGGFCEVELTIGRISEYVAAETDEMITSFYMTYDTQIKSEIYTNGDYELKDGDYFGVKIQKKRNGIKKVCFERAGKIG